MTPKLALFCILAVLAAFWAIPGHAQITCTQLGAFTTCDNGTIQADLGHGHGVIIDKDKTTPYTILTPPSPERPTSPVLIPVPTEEPSGMSRIYRYDTPRSMREEPANEGLPAYLRE
jgi:hypothetical protein